MDDWVISSFYCIEGLDGIGKTTAARELKDLCALRGKDIWVTKEPTDSISGLLARAFLKDGDTVLLSHLFAADRYSHLYGKGGIIETTRGGKPVITDRYFFSNLVYQGFEFGKELTSSVLPNIGHMVDVLNAEFPYPAAVFYLKADPHVALERQKKRGDEILDFRIDKLLVLEHRYDLLFKGLDKTGPRGMNIVELDASLPPYDIACAMYDEIFKEKEDEDHRCQLPHRS